MKKISPCDLNSCFLCWGCLEDWVPLIGANRQNLKFKKGKRIFSEGENVEGIYFLYRGKVKIHKEWGADKELIVRFTKESDMFGYRGLGDDRVYPVSATALEDVTVCFIDTAFFETTLKVNHQLTYSLMQLYANELHDAEKRMRNLAHMEVKGRVADTLLMLKRIFGRDEAGFINITLTKQDMASYAGTTYETFSRIISDMVNEGLLRWSGKNVSILKEARLLELTKIK